MSNPLAFGEYVKHRREAIGKSLRGLAAELKISAPYLSDIEKGKRYAPANYLSQFISALHIEDNDEINYFYDLAGANKNGQHLDINSYMDNIPNARVALRTAKDKQLTNDDWLRIIEYINQHNT